MAPRPDVSEERKNQILEAATTVFARLGFHKARMDDIVEEAHLSKGALYWYFRSKDAVIEALLNRIFDIEFAELHTLIHTEGPAGERLITYARRSAADLERMTWFVPIALEFYGLISRHNVVKQSVKQYLRRFQEGLGEIIRQGIDSGEFRNVDPQAAATAMTGMYEGLGLLWLVDPETVPLRRSIEASMRLMLEGIMEEPKGPGARGQRLGSVQATSPWSPASS